MHWRRKWQPTPVFLPGESQERGSLVGCRLWGHRVGHDWSDLAAAAFYWLPWWFSGKESARIVRDRLQCRRPGLDPSVRKIPWRRKWQPTPVFLPREFHGQRSLVGYSPWSRQESDTTEWLSAHIHQMITSTVNTGWALIDMSMCNPAMTLVLKWCAVYQRPWGSVGGFLEFGSSIYHWPGVRLLVLGPFLKDYPPWLSYTQNETFSNDEAHIKNNNNNNNSVNHQPTLKWCWYAIENSFYPRTWIFPVNA